MDSDEILSVCWNSGLIAAAARLQVAKQILNITPEIMGALAALRHEPKFRERKGSHYPGAPDESTRLQAQYAVDTMLNRLLARLKASPTKEFVLSEFQIMLDNFDSLEPDTLEREEACAYCERVMLLVGIERSDGLLNRWMYGFDPDEVSAQIRLTKATVKFHTSGDGKARDTKLWIEIRRGAEIVGRADCFADTIEFRDGSDNGPFDIRIISTIPKSEVVRAGDLVLHIEPSGSNAWRFKFTVTLIYSNGMLEKVSSSAQVLSDTQNELVIPLFPR
jgi:hypothetical protein